MVQPTGTVRVAVTLVHVMLSWELYTKCTVNACETFITQLKKFKLKYTADDEERESLRKSLIEVRAYCESLEEALKGSDDPEAPKD